MSVNRLRLAIIGLNNQGWDHLIAALACPQMRVTAACDSSVEQRERAREHVGPELQTFASMEELFSSNVADAAVVALPHDLHARVVELAAEHRVHLLKEKPLGRSLREAHKMAAVIRRAGIVLHTGVQRRHHPTYAAVGNALAQTGRRVRSADVEITVVPKEGIGAPTWRHDYTRAGGGVLIDLGYHGVDLAQFLLGPLELVSCTLSTAARLNAAETVESDANVWARADQCWVHLRFGRAKQKRERVRLQCDSGSFEADRARAVWKPLEGPEQILCTAPGDWQATLLTQLGAFADAVARGTDAPNDLDSQLPALRFLESCYAQWRLDGVVAEGES
jgi:predicted dehydrogenase